MILGYGKVVSRIIYLGLKKEHNFIDFGFSTNYPQNYHLHFGGKIIAFANWTVNILAKFAAALSIKHVTYNLAICRI